MNPLIKGARIRIRSGPFAGKSGEVKRFDLANEAAYVWIDGQLEYVYLREIGW